MGPKSRTMLCVDCAFFSIHPYKHDVFGPNFSNLPTRYTTLVLSNNIPNAFYDTKHTQIFVNASYKNNDEYRRKRTRKKEKKIATKKKKCAACTLFSIPVRHKNSGSHNSTC